MAGKKEKVVLAYSGGLDTSVAIQWLAEKYNVDIITLTVDVGNPKDFAAAREKALKIGALKAIVIDAKEMFVKYFIWHALQANALYEGQYPLATALSRPLMAKLLVDTALEEGANSVAHGCTGKGNDQVRFDVGVHALAPHLKVLAPAREWGMTRAETIAYAHKRGIPIPITKKSPYSIDECLWGRSIETGVLEDPWVEPPADVYTWTKSPDKTPNKPAYVEIGFEKGIPVSLDGQEYDGVTLIQRMNELAGDHGIGRIDHIENRLVGIKSREIYEAPAATVLLQAHQALEAMTLSKDQMRFKQKVAIEIADIIYNGLWFSAQNRDLAAYIQSSQRYVTGTIRTKLFKGSAQVVGRTAPKSLYNLSLATYDKGDKFDQSMSVGFIHIWGLPVVTQSQVQLLGDTEGPLSIIAPKKQLKKTKTAPGKPARKPNRSKQEQGKG
ncbi:MAG: argininosuccinate synthase [Dehalococcoidia bacterium]|nr:argininosuccinate synthase [Dehalococcoidia bacterium]